MEEKFTHIYHSNYWGDPNSRSGTGSSLEATEAIRRALPEVFPTPSTSPTPPTPHSRFTLLDIPCGDVWWGLPQLVTRCGGEYIGADLVRALIERNRERYPEYQWLVRDITSSELPRADVTLVRDCLGHLPDAAVWAALANVPRPTCLVATTFEDAPVHEDIAVGWWRPINLRHFGLVPDKLIAEDHPGKYLGVYYLT